MADRNIDYDFLTPPLYNAMSSWVEHVPFAMWLIRRARPRVFVELGSHYGMSYFAFCQTVAARDLGTRCYAVDTWAGDEHAGFYSDEVYQQVKAHNEAHYSEFSSLMRMRFDEALEHVPDGSVDLLHIDGRHYYEDVKEDFETWERKLSDRAIVLFHDTTVRERGFGVWKLWEELAGRYPSFNFVHGHGLGVIAHGKTIPEEMAPFFDMARDPEAVRDLRWIFRQTGKLLGDRNTAQDSVKDTKVLVADLRQHVANIEGGIGAIHNLFTGDETSDVGERLQAILQGAQELTGLNGGNRIEPGQLRARIAAHSEEVARLEAQIDEQKQALAGAEARAVAAEANARASVETERQIAVLAAELAHARRKAFKTLGDYLKFKMLRKLAKFSPPIPSRTAARFARSASKRNPMRSVTEYARADTPALAHAGSAVEGPAIRPTVTGDPARETVVVVSHDATRTGAPVLAYNLARELEKDFNVVCLLMGPGELHDEFEAHSIATYEIDRRFMTDAQIGEAVNRICDFHKPAFVIANSVESRRCLPPFKGRGVPTVSLLHEFAANIRPVTAFPEVFATADQVVFSTRITLENALEQHAMERTQSVHILPQGKCMIPGSMKNPGASETERDWLRGLLRPGGKDDDSFLVIGGGALEWRKGLDLFVETANQVINAPGGGKFRFVWIGSGYDPENDTQHSVHIADQIRRSGLGSQMKVIRATSEIELAYELADLFLLSSRLDPLPNVTIDALCVGTPVVCIDRTTGIADFLAGAGLGEACVADYMNPASMAARVRALAEDAELHAEVSARGKAAALERFDFPGYVRKLVAIARSSVDTEKQVAKDIDYLLASGAFRKDFNVPADRRVPSDRDAIADYVKSNRAGGYPRKPAPGFHPILYAAHETFADGPDPFVRYLEAGRPAGPWASQVIEGAPGAAPRPPAELKVGLHIHAFYPDLLAKMIDRLEGNASRPDLLLSAPASQLDAVRAASAAYSGKVVQVQSVPNRGRDLAPMLTLFGAQLVADYDVIGHLHTKKSPHVTERKFVDSWSNFLFENLLGGDKGGAMLDRILSRMAEDPGIGLVYPDDPHIISWNQNRPQAERIARMMDLPALPDQFNFPIGSMLWARSAVLKPFVDLNLDWSDYPSEPIPIDGTVLHAIERLFGVVPGMKGLSTAVTNVPGVTR